MVIWSGFAILKLSLYSRQKVEYFAVLFLIPTLAAVKDSIANVLARKTVEGVHRFLDVRMGILGALSMGLIVYFINSDHGMIAGAIAALKQGLYTFFFGALFVKMAENIALHFSSILKAVIIGGVAPALLTSALTYVLHAIKGTPEPFNSTLPTMVLSIISFSIWAYLKHRSAFNSKHDS